MSASAVSAQQCVAEFFCRARQVHEYLSTFPKSMLYRSYSLLADNRVSSQMAESSKRHVFVVASSSFVGSVDFLPDASAIARQIRHTSKRATRGYCHDVAQQAQRVRGPVRSCEGDPCEVCGPDYLLTPAVANGARFLRDAHTGCCDSENLFQTASLKPSMSGGATP